jgi:hypothetical protein
LRTIINVKLATVITSGGLAQPTAADGHDFAALAAAGRKRGTAMSVAR